MYILQTLVPCGEASTDKVTALSQVKYLATTSGGSWFNAALSYTPSDVDGKTPKPQVPLDTFLGDIDQVRSETTSQPGSDSCVTAAGLAHWQ